jgi:competence protein ComEC
MVGIALFAILVDRSPLSIRLVAFAAFLVLLFSPESLTTASFQMSFGAVAALVVVFDWMRPWLSAQHRAAGPVKKAALYFLGVCLTTIIATIATTPLTAFHFQQLTIYGVIGNGLAVPLSSFVIMPAAVLSVLAMPLGLEYWPLRVMEWGVAGMIDISYWVAGLPHALVKIPAFPPVVLPLLAAGIIWLVLWNGYLRFLAAVPVLVAVWITLAYQPADILVSPRFGIVAVKDDALYVSSLRKEKFIGEKWESLYGLHKGEAKGWPREGRAGPLVCDEAACRAELRGRHVSILRSPAALAEECAWADVVLAFDPVKGPCRVPVIDKFDAISNGAYGMWLGPDSIRILSAEAARGLRPWSGGNRDFSQHFSDKNASGSPAGPGF